MAAYMVRKGRWTATVCIRPFRKIAKTFATKEAAKSWADIEEARLRALRQKARDSGHALDINVAARPEFELIALPRFRPNEMSGVYFLMKDDACVYVGSSDNVHGRVREHFKSGAKTSNFDSYTFVSCPIETMRETERTYIQLLNPPLNSVWKRKLQILLHRS